MSMEDSIWKCIEYIAYLDYFLQNVDVFQKNSVENCVQKGTRAESLLLSVVLVV